VSRVGGPETSVRRGPSGGADRVEAGVRLRPSRGPDGFEAAVVVVLAALAVAVLAGLLLRVWLRGGLVTGADGFLVADPMQYLDWARQAGEHWLIANRQDLKDGPRAFLHPGLLVSGLLYRLGAGPALTYLAWKPVAVAVLFAGTAWLARRTVARTDDRRLALVLALFFCSPVAAIVGWGGLGSEGDKLSIDFVTGELWTGSYLWGYVFTAIAVGLLPLALLAYDRGRDGGRPGALALAAAGGLLCAWLQPWQGATFALVLGAAEAVAVRRDRSAGAQARDLSAPSTPAAAAHGRSGGAAARDLAWPLIATAAPLLYYLVLSLADPSWELAGRVNDLPRWPWWVLVAGLAPLAVPAAFAYGLPARGFVDVALRAWPAAGLLVYFQPFGTFPFHALQGLAVPLSILAVLAVRARLGDRALRLTPAVGVVLVLCVVGTAYRVAELADAVHLGRQPFFLTASERDALRHLESEPQSGGVLAPVYSGILVPAYTGRETWIGAGSWTPRQPQRTEEAEALFAGRLDAAQAEALVRRSGARFLYSDCHGRADIEALVRRFTEPPRRFGCATVWRVR
jgi:hypothetical protein